MKINKGYRLTGEERRGVRKSIVAWYENGWSVRRIAEHLGRSYGFVHRMLQEAGVQMRPRGGGNNTKRR